MKLRRSSTFLGAAALLAANASHAADPRLRDIEYDPQGVVAVPVKRGVITLISLDPDEAIVELATGLGSDCGKTDAVWCVAAQAGGRDIFVKPKSGAAAPNTIAVVTDRRAHALRLVVLADDDKREPIYRLSIRAPSARPVRPVEPVLRPPPSPTIMAPSPQAVVRERLQSAPRMANSDYSLAEGKNSAAIVPTLAFDDGRFTYLRFAGNLALPAVFDVLADGSEALANTRMEGELLVVDRVSRRLMLRAGAAVVEIWNEAFDPEGPATTRGTTVDGVQRLLRAEVRL